MGAGLRAPGEHWSGEATRGGGFAVQEARVDVTIGEEERTTEVAKKERPVWMVESTVITNDPQASLLVNSSCYFKPLVSYKVADGELQNKLCLSIDPQSFPMQINFIIQHRLQ